MARRLVYDLFHGLDNTVWGDNEVRGDEIRGGDGNDKLFGFDGDDLLLGGNDNDLLFGGRGNDEVQGNAGDDTLFMDRGDNTFNGGEGVDKLDFADYYLSLPFGIYDYVERDVGFKVDLTTGETFASTVSNSAFTDRYGKNTFTSIEQYFLTNHNDVLRGDGTSDVISGRDGNDFIEGRGGADRIFGDNDIDTASYESSSQGVDVSLDRFGEQIGGDAAGDVLRSVENLVGSGHNDHLGGDGGRNRIDGGNGADAITGLGGRDTIIGGLGADFFIFTNTSDSVGSFTQRDVIEDFQRDVPGRFGDPRAIVGDSIDLHPMDADQRRGSTSNEDFTFIGSQAFTGRAGEVRVSFQDNEGNPFTLVQADVTGDRVADFALTVFTNNDTLLTAADFLL